MQLLHLYYFKLLAENEHLMNTAKMIPISPPALSSTISKLENELGVLLFDRVGRKIVLNENGRILYVHVCKIFTEIDNIKSDLAKKSKVQQDVVKVGVTANPLWTKPITTFMKKNPNVTVMHSAIRDADLQNPEVLNRFDLIITDLYDIDNKAWEHEFIIEDPPVLLINQDHPFAIRDCIALSEARNEAFIALPSGFSSRTWFNKACMQSGFVPHIAAETDYMLRTQLIESGYGIGFSSILGSRAISSSSVCMVRVKYPPNPRIQTIFWKAGASHSPSVIKFKEYVIEYYNNLAKELKKYIV